MSFPPYPEYRDSGVEWLGDVPAHWHSLPLKYVAREKGSVFIDGDWIESKDISDSGIRYITTGNVGEGIYKEQGAGFITEATFSALNCTEVFSGDVLISRLNLPIGRACVVPELGHRIVTSVDNVIVRADQSICRKFLVYAMSSGEHFATTEILARGSTMQRISRTMLGNLRIYLPNQEEQEAIAVFLDRETAKIDALVAEQEKLIALLKEKRQAVISHAVTKGLDPDAPMKDSGIEWLSEVPAHWDVARMSHLEYSGSDFVSGPFGSSLGSDDYVDDGIPVIRGLNTALRAESRFVAEDFVFVSEEKYAELARCDARPGDLVFTARGTVGKVGIVPDHLETALISPNQLRYRPVNPMVVGAYLFYFFSSENVLSEVSLIAESVAQPNLNLGNLKSIRVLLPPRGEQRAIVEFLDIETRRIDNLADQAKKAIELIKERRSALISAAVTGKIDVRGTAALEAAA